MLALSGPSDGWGSYAIEKPWSAASVRIYGGGGDVDKLLRLLSDLIGSIGERLILDARAVGLAAGASGLLLRAPVLIVVVITMATTAAARALLTRSRCSS